MLAHDSRPRPEIKAPRAPEWREPWPAWFRQEVTPLLHSGFDTSPEHRVEWTRDSPLRFALTYLDHHLVLQESDPPLVTFSVAHLALCRSARGWQYKKPWREAWIAPRGLGKALALDTPVLTVAHGWTTHGELRVGDQVFDERGVPCNVVRVSERWTDRPCYRVTFSDGEQIVADENHEWWVNDRYSDLAERIESTARISEKWLLTEARGWREVRYSVPVAGPLQYPKADLPIAPYVLGAWLGDGTSRAGQITVGDEDLEHLTEQLRVEGENPVVHRGGTAWTLNLAKPRPHLCPREHVLEPPNPGAQGSHRPCRHCIAQMQWHSYRDSSIGPRTNRPLIARLRDLDLLQNKHIPEQYFTASVAQRVALLQGLMDTDGTIGAGGTCEFSVTNGRLAHDVQRLVHTLGIKSQIKESRARIAGVDKGPRWRLTFHTDQSVFRLPRKLERVPTSIRAAGNRRIVNVERVENQTTSCVEVDSPSHLYLVGRSLVPTHNSVWAYLVLPLWALAHGHRKFLLAFSFNLDQAKGHMANLREELETNDLLLQDYPHLRSNRGRGSRNTATTVANGEIMLASRGLQGTVLGMRHGTIRPDLIIGDDLEPMEDKHSPELKEQLLRNLTSAILPMGAPHAAVGIFGTVTMYRSITHDLVIHGKGRERIGWVDNTGFRSRIFPGVLEDPVTGQETSLWPERWRLTPTHLGEHKRGTRDFALNFELDPTPAQGTRGGGFWRPERFQYMDSDRFGAIEHVLYVDPGLQTGPRNDPTAMVVVGRDPSRRRAIVERAWHGHVTGEQIRQRIHAFAEQEPSLRTVIFEANAGGSEHWATTLAPAGKPLPRSIELVWDWASTSKEARIKAAHAAYERDQVWHARPLRELEEQLVMWPDPRRHDDLIDALAGALRWAFDRKL